MNKLNLCLMKSRSGKTSINILRRKVKLYEDLTVALNEQRRVSEELQRSNKELEKYVKSLEETISITPHKGKMVSETSNKTRTLKSFLSRVQTALWFSKSFGIALDALSVKECDSGLVHHLKVSGQPQEKSSIGGSNYNNLDSFYHKLSMTINGLPRSYLVK